jgi:malate dehydrogenase
MSRDDLLHANADIMKTVAGEATKHSPEAILIVVTNPMDVMAQLVSDLTDYPSGRVIGMGGVLDSARLRTFVALEAGVSVKDVEAMVLGGHGDQMVPLPRFTTVKGVPITELFSAGRITALVERTRHGGAEIVSLLKAGSAYYAPAAATYDMVRSILFDERRMLPCAVRLDGQYGLSGMFSGVPVVLGRRGIEKIIELNLTEEEQGLLEASARSVKALVDKLKA